MEQQALLLDILYIAAFFLGGLGFALGPIILAHLLAPKKTREVSGRSKQFVECGVEPIGSAWIRFGAVYYLYALIFLAFDVDVLFLFPVAAAYKNLPDALAVRSFVEIVLFVAILSLAIIYAWKKGVFTWTRKQSIPH